MMNETEKGLTGMTITPVIRESHEKLSSWNVAFLEYAGKNPEYLQHSQFPVITRWQNKASIAKLHPWPLFISRRTRGELEDASVNVLKLIKSIPRRLFSGNPQRMSDYYGLSTDYVTWCLSCTNDEHIEKLLARGDFIFSKSGLKCLEYNISSALGGWWLPIWESLYLKNPLIAGFINSHKLKITNKNLLFIFLDHLTKATLEYFPNEDEINIAILVFDRGTVEALSGLVEYFNRLYRRCLPEQLKGEVIFCAFDQFIIAGGNFYYKGKKVRAILEFADGDIPQGVITLFKGRNLFLLNGPVSGLMSNKLNLALLSEHENSDLFTPEERKIIKKYIPWTRKVIDGSTTYGDEKIDLKSFMLSHREKLVLKPAKGKGGVDVHVGYHICEDLWGKLVREAFHEVPWVVQERVESLPFLLQEGENGCVEHDVAWGIFVLGSLYGGVLLRLLPRQNSNGVINTQQGAWSSLVFDVDE